MTPPPAREALNLLRHRRGVKMPALAAALLLDRAVLRDDEDDAAAVVVAVVITGDADRVHQRLDIARGLSREVTSDRQRETMRSYFIIMGPSARWSRAGGAQSFFASSRMPSRFSSFS